MRKHHFKRVALGATALSMLFAGSAFTASNSMPVDHTAGVGAVAVSGTAVDSMVYDLDSTRTTVNNVKFTTAKDITGMTAEVSLDGGNAWDDCTIGDDGVTWTITCSTWTNNSDQFADVTNVRLVVTDGTQSGDDITVNAAA